MNIEKDDFYYLDLALKNIDFIVSQSAGISFAHFKASPLLIDSMVFRLIQVSESIDRLSEGFKDSCKQIPWRDIKGFRNRLVHDYGSVDVRFVFEAVTNDIPRLQKSFQQKIR